MAYVTAEDIAKAREMDLLTYLRNYEPHELVNVANGTYCTREHDSLKISNGMWYWFSRSIGGSTALDYLIQVKGYSLPEAVETILGRSLEKPPVSYKQPDRSSKVLLLPPRNENPRKVTAYLRSRGIHPVIIDYCYRNNLLYEGMPYHNAVFIGYDEKGVPRYAALRGTVSKYKGEATGSDKQHSFNIPADRGSAALMLALLTIVQGIISSVMNATGSSAPSPTALPEEIILAVESAGFLESIPLWAVTLIGGIFIWVLAFTMILTVYGRFFKLYMYTAIAPIPLSTFAGEPTQSVGISFLKSYAAVCLEGAIIVLSCVIFSVFASSAPTVDPDAAAVTMVWTYIGELIFNMLILTGTVKLSDRVVHEMIGV